MRFSFLQALPGWHEMKTRQYKYCYKRPDRYRMQKPDSERPDKMYKQARKEIAQLQFLSQEPGFVNQSTLFQENGDWQINRKLKVFSSHFLAFATHL